MNVLHLLSSDNFITVNRSVARKIGLEAAVILGELASEHLYWESRNELDDGYFFSTVENLEERTSLSAYNQRQAIEKLKEQGLIDVVRKGMPSKRYIRLNADRIADFLVDNYLLKNCTTTDEKIAPLLMKNFNTNKTEDNKTEEKDIIEVSSKSPSLVDILEQAPIVAENPELKESLKEFIRMRKKLKAPLTERALKMIINEAFKLSGGKPELMREIVDQSIMNSWKGVYPIKENQKQPNIEKRSLNPFTDLLRAEGFDDYKE